MYVMTKFERNFSLEYYYTTCIDTQAKEVYYMFQAWEKNYRGKGGGEGGVSRKTQ